MKILAAILVALFIVCQVMALSGCDRTPEKRPAWQDAFLTHVCDEEQMKKAKLQAEFCDQASPMPRSRCYGEAILNTCTAK